VNYGAPGPKVYNRNTKLEEIMEDDQMLEELATKNGYLLD
jgi:hypothetical protein